MTSQILPAEHVGKARHDKDGNLPIGTGDGTVTINLSRPGFPGWWNTGDVDVYVRRDSDDLSVIEIHMTRHDGPSQEQLDEQNRQAAIYPAGPKEYWRGEMVGKYTYGLDQHAMTDAEFEDDWN